MPELFNKKWFQLATIAFIILEVLSLWSYHFSFLNVLTLILVILLAVVLMWRYPSFLIIIPLGEIAWGSLGRTFYWDFGGYSLSLRMLLFALVILVWLFKYLPSIKKFPWQNLLGKSYLVLLGVLGWGLVAGLLEGNSLLNIFNDSNGFYFFIYLLIWYPFFNHKIFTAITSVLLAAGLVVATKTLFIFHLFAHGYELANIPYFYLWVRDTKVGELTLVIGNFWRIFFQSHFWLVAIFLFVSFWTMLVHNFKKSWSLVLYLGTLFSAILISFSRSFWLAMIVTTLVFLLYYFITVLPKKIFTFKDRFYSLVTAGLIGVVLVAVTLFIPPVDADLGKALASRLADSGEAAASSRLNQLPKLLEKLEQSPVFGHGFGTTITYQNNDPRVRNFLNPDGSYTTFAFELGWLDLAVKVGLLGALLFFAFLIVPICEAFKKLKEKNLEIVVPSVSLIFLQILVHSFTPYLNHPLGIGLLILVILMIYKLPKYESHH